MERSDSPTDAPAVQERAPAKFPVHPLAGVALVVVTYIAAMVVAPLLLTVFPIFFGYSEQEITSWFTDSPFGQFIYVLVFEAVTIAILVAFMRSKQIKLASIGFLKPRLRDLGVALLAYPPYFLINAGAALAATAVFHLDTNQRQQLGFDNVTTTPQLVVTFISLVILPPLVEEFVMRGFLFSSLKNGMKVIPAALVTSVLFAAAHLQFGQDAPLLWLAALDTFILSLVLCYIRQKTGSLWAGIGLHMIKNGLAFAVLFLLPESVLGL